MRTVKWPTTTTTKVLLWKPKSQNFHNWHVWTYLSLAAKDVHSVRVTQELPLGPVGEQPTALRLIVCGGN